MLHLYEVTTYFPNLYGEFKISEVDPWTRTLISVDVGTFAVPLWTYLLINTDIKGVPIPSSDKYTCIRKGYIKKLI